MTDNINRTKEGIHGFTQTECDEMIASIGVGGTKMLRMTWSSFLNNFNKSLDA